MEQRNEFDARHAFTAGKDITNSPEYRLRLAFKDHVVLTSFVAMIMTNWYLKLKNEKWMKDWVGNADWQSYPLRLS